jgi:hypothetical protein
MSTKLRRRHGFKHRKIHQEIVPFTKAVRNQASNAVRYEKDVLHDPLVTTDTGRTRGSDNRFIRHVSGCKILASAEYTTRNEKMRVALM